MKDYLGPLLMVLGLACVVTGLWMTSQEAHHDEIMACIKAGHTPAECETRKDAK